MGAAVEWVDRAMAGRVRAALARHPTYSDYASKIPEPMFRQLVREGFARVVVYCLGTLLLISVGYYALPAWEGKPVQNEQAAAWVLYVLFALAEGWRTVVGRCIERECVYRRKHGKWRWE
jgi:hypothetical protein